MKHRTYRSILVPLLLALVGSPSFGQRRSNRAAAGAARSPAPKNLAGTANQVRGDEITPETKAAVEKGLAWLALTRSRAAGSRQPRASATPTTSPSPRWRAWRSWKPAIFPAAASTAGKFASCVDFMLDNSQESGLIAADAGQGPMYGHGFATLFLGEVYGMTARRQASRKSSNAPSA